MRGGGKKGMPRQDPLFGPSSFSTPPTHFIAVVQKITQLAYSTIFPVARVDLAGWGGKKEIESKKADDQGENGRARLERNEKPSQRERE
jgi:hypothetical protein